MTAIPAQLLHLLASRRRTRDHDIWPAPRTAFGPTAPSIRQPGAPALFRGALAALCLGVLLVGIDNTIVNVPALPTIGRELDAEHQRPAVELVETATPWYSRRCCCSPDIWVTDSDGAGCC